MAVHPQQNVAPEANEPNRQTSVWQTHWQKGVALALWLLLIGAYLWYSQVNDLGPFAAARRLLALIRGSALGPLLFIVIYILRPLIFFSSAVLTLLGGFLFGPVWGIVYVMVGSNLSALLAYTIGYFFGEGVLQEEDGAEGVPQRYARRLRRHSFETVLIMRFLFLPFDAVSYLAGFLRVDWKAFGLATLLGSIPGGVAVTLAGASGHLDAGGLRLDPRVLLMAAGLFFLSLGLSHYLRRREQQRASSG